VESGGCLVHGELETLRYVAWAAALPGSLLALGPHAI
jgi:hypothetical protein